MSCPDCFRGHEHEGTPKGKVLEIHGKPTYVSEPGEGIESKGIIVIVPDAFGWEFNNSRLMADHYASQGPFTVYLPDFMDGWACPAWMVQSMAGLTDTGISGWLWKPYHTLWIMSKGIPFILFNRFGISWPKVHSFFDALRCNEAKDLPLGAAGFCWGGKHIVNLAHGGLATNGLPLVDAVFTGHPSMLEIPAELEKVVKPLSIAIGDKDIILKTSELEKVKTALGKVEAKSEVIVYEGAGHGFCVRADPKNEKVMQQSAAAEDQALKWFKLHFAGTSYGGH